MAHLISVSPYFWITRPINLLLIVITQCAVYFGVILRFLNHYDLPPSLTIPQFILLVLSTLIIGTSGYIINDIYDTDVDWLNKPKKQFIGHSISKRNAGYYYWSLVIIGGTISIYLAFSIDQLFLFIIYPVAVFMMFLYSYAFKRKVLLGNIIVALFCGFVPGIVVFAERSSIFHSHSETYLYQHLQMVLIAFIILSFLGNFIREIVKDMEDMKGDQLAGARTFPIVVGMEKSKIFSFFNMLLLSILIFLWMIYIFNYGNLILHIITICTLTIPSFYLLFLVNRIKTKKDCSTVSRGLKILMAFGLLNLILTGIFTL